jgi:hypothetical protein
VRTGAQKPKDTKIPTSQNTIMDPKIDFHKKFQKERTESGKTLYVFPVESSAIEEEGILIDPDAPQIRENIWKIPDSCASYTHSIMESWLTQCSSAFAKNPPSAEACQKNTHVLVDETVSVPSISPEEENKEWVICWKPTKIVIDAPKFNLYWGPVTKRENTRIQEDIMAGLNLEETAAEQEENQDVAPVADLDAIPVINEENFRLDQRAMQKDITRIKNAYLKAHIYYEKAEHMNTEFFQKYGFYAITEDDSESMESEMDELE